MEPANQQGDSRQTGSPLPDLNSITLLIEKARGGCADSRDKVFGQLQSYLEVVASRHANTNLLRKAGVSDIVQQSFVKVVENFDNFRGVSGPEFRGWLKALVINEARQINRNWNRQRRNTDREEYIDALPGGDNRLDAGNPTPGSEAIRKEQFQLLKAAIAKLPEDYQTVIKLRNFESRSYTEIAEQMERSVEAATKLWYRAVVKLQQSMLDEE